MAAPPDLPSVLSQLKGFVESMLKDPGASMSPAEYIELYDLVVLLSVRILPPGMLAGQLPPYPPKKPPAEIDVVLHATQAGCAPSRPMSQHRLFYQRLAAALDSHCKSVQNDLAPLSQQDLLSSYARHRSQYTTATKRMSRVFRYFDRHWIQRERDEGGKEVLFVADLAQEVWQAEVFSPLVEKLANGNEADLPPGQLRVVQEAQAAVKKRDKKAAKADVKEAKKGKGVAGGTQHDKDGEQARVTCPGMGRLEP